MVLAQLDLQNEIKSLPLTIQKKKKKEPMKMDQTPKSKTLKL